MITRHFGPVKLEAIRASTFEAVFNLEDLPRRWVVSDQFAGTWRPHSIARDFLEQIESSQWQYSHPVWIPKAGEGVGDYGQAVADGIDGETAGDVLTMAARLLADQLVRSVRYNEPVLFLVILPGISLQLEEDDTLFLEFLVAGLQNSSHRIVLMCSGSRAALLPAHWDVSWISVTESPAKQEARNNVVAVPGLLNRNVDPGGFVYPESKCTWTVAIGCGRYVIAPAVRRPPAQWSATIFRQMRQSGNWPEWVKIYSQFYASDRECDFRFVERYAWLCYGAGCVSLALRFFNRIRLAARGTLQQAVVDSKIQGIRIGALRFHAAAAVQDPADELPTELRSFLLQAKGWGLVWTGRFTEAKEYLANSLRLRAANWEDATFLYLQNIYALSLFRSGDEDGALKIEREIAEALPRIVRDRWQLEYVNSINQARLYRARHDSASAIAFYQRAFATAGELKSESDQLYESITLARVLEDSGDRSGAFAHWLRAGVVFASASAPEAIAPRVVTGFLGHYSSDRGELVERMAAKLADHLSNASKAVGKSNGERSTHPENGVWPIFAPISDLDPSKISESVAISGRGWSAIASPTAISPRFEGPEFRKLSSSLWNSIGCEDNAIFGAGCFRSVFISVNDYPDDGVGCIPAINLCTRFGVSTLNCEGSVIHLSTVFREAIKRRLETRIAPAVDKITLSARCQSVAYKRYKSERPVTCEEAVVLGRVGGGINIEELTSLCLAAGLSEFEFRRAIDALVIDSVLKIYLPEGICGTEGMAPCRIRTGHQAADRSDVYWQSSTANS